MRHPAATCLLALLLAAPALAQEVAPAPAAQAQLSPELDALLTRIEARAKTVRTMSSRVRLTRQQGLLGDSQVRFGQFHYARPTPAKAQGETGITGAPGLPARVRIDFDRVVVDGKAERVDIRYVFDGHWLLETILKDHSANRREIRAQGDPKDALALGGGVLPLPLSFEKAAVLARFDVALGKPGQAEDGREAVRLILTPKKGVKLDVDKMELVFAKDTLEPIGALSTHGEDATEILLSKPAFNPELPEKTFDTTAPQGNEWQVQEVPLK